MIGDGRLQRDAARSGEVKSQERKGAIIDVHAHIAVKDYLSALAEAGIRSPGYGGATRSPTASGSGAGGESPESLELRIAMMDKAGVRTQILSPSLAPYIANEDHSVRATRLLNDRLARTASFHPGRLAAYVSLPLPHVDAALSEMRRGLDVLGMAGVAMHATCLGVSIADPVFDPLFVEMNARNAVLFVHPCVNGLCSHLLNDWNLEACAGPLLEDVTIGLQLLARSIPVRYPNIRIVIPHLGGGLAAMLERLDNQMPLAIPGLLGQPSAMARTFWFDTVSHGSAAALKCAVDAFGHHRIVPGSDFPVLLSFEAYERTFGYVDDVYPNSNVGADILRHNAAVLFEGRIQT
jgi:predicted TIM-barrel fold metal-dependent hydrolase